MTQLPRSSPPPGPPAPVPAQRGVGHPPPFPISLYGWTYWAPILAAGVAGIIVFAIIPGTAWISVAFAILTVACLAFYRDFHRAIPRDADVMVAPADGKITEIATLPLYPPFDGPALRISIFLSVLDVHVNRSPCDAVVLWTRYEEGLFLDARHPDCAAKNQSHTLCLAAPGEPRRPIAVVKQIVGAIARRIIAPVAPGEFLARGQRFGMIAFGSRTELYVPADQWQPAVPLNSHVRGGRDILVRKAKRQTSPS